MISLKMKIGNVKTKHLYTYSRMIAQVVKADDICVGEGEVINHWRLQFIFP